MFDKTFDNVIFMTFTLGLHLIFGMVIYITLDILKKFLFV